jgi:DNA-binding IclR family transcriptional regulator
VGVVSKVLKILEALHGSPAGLQLKQIAHETGIHKSTAYRFLAHMEGEGYLFRDDAGAYVVGPKLLRLGSGLTYQASLRKMSRPILQRLWKITGETVNLALLDGQDVLYIDVLESSYTFRLVSQVGMRRPLYCTALGKSLVAYLPAEEKEHVLSSLSFERFTPHTTTRLSQLRNELARVRQRGYALDDEETVLGSRCVSAPILLGNGKVAAAISVAGPVTRISRDKIPAFVAAVQEAARTISARLGFSELQHKAMSSLSKSTSGEGRQESFASREKGRRVDGRA